MLTRNKHVFMDQAQDGGQGSAAGGGAGTGGQAAGAPAGSGQSGANGAAGGAGTASGSALAAGQAAAGSGQSAAGSAGTNANDWLPEKYRVAKEDGSLDIEASARKVADAHRHLEQRLGSGDVPPKSPEDYDLKGLPDVVSMDEMKADPEMQSFLKAAHGKGLTNEQVSFVLNQYLQRAPEIAGAGQVMNTEETTQALRGIWKDEASYSANLGQAYKAANVIASKSGVSFEELEQSGLGNHPVFIRLMASIGPELAEDLPPGEGAGSVATDFEAQKAELQANPAYNDPKHPQHKQVMDKMSALYARRYGTKAQKLFSGVGN